MRVDGSLSLSLSLPVFSAVFPPLVFFGPLCVLCCSRLFSLYRFVFWMCSNEVSVIRTTFWCTSQSAPRLRASASKCKACSLLHYCTCCFILLLYNIYSDLSYFADWDYCVLIGCYFWHVINQMVLWAGHSERMLHHIFRLTTKRNKKTLMLIIGNILDIDQCVHRSVPNNQDNSWSMLPESEVYKDIIRLLHLYNLKQTSASALKLY